MQKQKRKCIYIYIYIHIHCKLLIASKIERSQVIFNRPCGSPKSHLAGAINICCVSSGTVKARYCCEPRDVKGANPVMKKWSRGKGTRFTAILRKSQFNCPGKRRQVVTPLMAALTRWFKSLEPPHGIVKALTTPKKVIPEGE